MGTVPIINLKRGDVIVPRVDIDDARISHWQFAAECNRLHGGRLARGVARMKIVDFSKQPGAMWVKVQIPGRHPPAYLKIAGGEYAAAFERG